MLPPSLGGREALLIPPPLHRTDEGLSERGSKPCSSTLGGQYRCRRNSALRNLTLSLQTQLFTTAAPSPTSGAITNVLPHSFWCSTQYGFHEPDPSEGRRDRPGANPSPQQAEWRSAHKESLWRGPLLPPRFKKNHVSPVGSVELLDAHAWRG